MEKVSDRDKLFKKFEMSRFHVDKDNHKEAKNDLQKLIRKKKKAYFKSKLTENIGEPKELWNCLKPLGLKFEGSIFNINCLDVKDIAKDFSTFFSSLAKT